MGFGKSQLFFLYHSDSCCSIEKKSEVLYFSLFCITKRSCLYPDSCVLLLFFCFFLFPRGFSEKPSQTLLSLFAITADTIFTTARTAQSPDQILRSE